MSRPRSVLLPIALVVSALGPVVPARADEARTGSLRAAATTAVEVAREELDVECRAGGEPDALECALRVTWTLRNPTESAQTPQVVLSWPREESAELRVAGAPLEELPTVRPVTVIVAPGGTTELELRATIMLESEFVGGASGISTPITAVDPLYARHPLLATPWVRARRGFTWARPDDLRFAAVGPTSVRLRAPEGWHASSDLRASDEAHVFRYASPEEQASRYVSLELTRGSRGDFFRHGGPFLALGGTIDAGFRGRIGYEIGLDEFVLVSVALDTDFERQVIVTPLVEVASWGMVLVPSLSLGLGVPIRVTDDGAEHPSTAGIRIESSATFYSVAFVATLDVWPVDGRYALSLLGRIGL